MGIIFGALARKLILLTAVAAASSAATLPIHRIAAMQVGGSCVTSIHPPSIGLQQPGGSFSLSLIAPAGCSWIITSSVPWLGADQLIGSGSAIVRFTAGQNPGTTRFGFLLINGQNVVVTQAGAGATACSFELTPASIVVPPVGQTGVLINTAGDPSCAWTALSHAPWIQVFPISGTGSVTMEYTVYPNFSMTARDGVANIGGRLFSISQLAATATFEERFVGMLYYNSFGRLPSTAELVQQVTALNSGALSRSDLVLSFFNSAEFNLGGRFIAGLYVGILNRDPEFSGWLFQRNALTRGRGNPSGFVTNFLNSLEFGLRFGSPTADEFVRILYRNILLREPSAGEVAFQVAALDSGVSRVQLAENFLSSSEFRTGTGPRLTAFLIYAVLLGRDASPDERSFRVAQLQSGVPVRTLIQQFLSAPEFVEQFE